ncbi:MAG: hypothetical protein LMBGKNDO_00588 [Bacteroidales bacterium]|mgnify:FL=1|jgi:hypothetical protein|nr:hypothetical protein [Bacteroidales bacterium]OQC56114.1 MAG: hypothetical protein BWX52_01843 [Bacteroidetes bacterium ADurb.Bin013]
MGAICLQDPFFLIPESSDYRFNIVEQESTALNKTQYCKYLNDLLHEFEYLRNIEFLVI